MRKTLLGIFLFDTLSAVTVDKFTLDEMGNKGVGVNNLFKGQRNSWIGDRNIMVGKDNNIQGLDNRVMGILNTIRGGVNTVDGQRNTIEGQQNSIKGENNLVIGEGNVVSNDLDIQKYNQVVQQLIPPWLRQTLTISPPKPQQAFYLPQQNIQTPTIQTATPISSNNQNTIKITQQPVVSYQPISTPKPILTINKPIASTSQNFYRSVDIQPKIESPRIINKPVQLIQQPTMLQPILIESKSSYSNRSPFNLKYLIEQQVKDRLGQDPTFRAM